MDSDPSLKSLNGFKSVCIKESILEYVKLARPHQYVKNGFIWLPLFFGYKLSDPLALFNTFCAFCAFSFAASAIYVLNDIKDVDEDRQHPRKKNRPIASGKVNPQNAVSFMLLLIGTSLSMTMALLPKTFMLIVIAYLLINFAYSFYLKHIAIIDVVCIAIGFVLRVLAGGVVSGVPVSPWIIIMTFLLAIFLALGKRRHDLVIVEHGSNTRKCLNGYNLEFVSFSMAIMTAVVIIVYFLYCLSPEVIQKHKTNDLYYTGIWVIVGLLRYLQLTFVEGKSDSPTLTLIHDPILWTVIGGWILTFYWLIYCAAH
jgi:decaprenyl-phosphate phosphoribosyltransferase